MNMIASPSKVTYNCVTCGGRYEVDGHSYNIIGFNFNTIICQSCQEDLKVMIKREREIRIKL